METKTSLRYQVLFDHIIENGNHSVDGVIYPQDTNFAAETKVSGTVIISANI